MMLGVIVAGANARDEQFDECTRLLKAGVVELLSDLPHKKAQKIHQRTKRLHGAVSAPYTREGMEVSKFGLVVFYWLKGLVESGYLVFASGSAIDRAIAIYIPAIEHAAQIAAVDQSAQKQARKLMAALQAAGYFR
jgi:hypothetical protein